MHPHHSANPPFVVEMKKKDQEAAIQLAIPAVNSDVTFVTLLVIALCAHTSTSCNCTSVTWALRAAGKHCLCLWTTGPLLTWQLYCKSRMMHVSLCMQAGYASLSSSISQYRTEIYIARVRPSCESP